MAGRILTAALYAIGVVLFYLGAAKLVRHLGRKNPKVLLYHDCSQSESWYTAGLDCTTSPAAFAKHLDYLQRHHEVVPLEKIVEGTAPPSSVAITFDDGYRSVYENALPLLVDRRLPAVLYLISDVIDNRSLVWVNELNYCLHSSPERALPLTRRFFADAPDGSPADVISHCRVRFDPKQTEELIAALRANFGYSSDQLALRDRLYITWDEIAKMGKLGFSFGNHTKTHPNLERLTEDQQLFEIREAQEVLSRRIPAVHSLAYPFGHHSPESASIAATIGLRSVSEVGGYNHPVDPLAIGRVHLSNQSIAGLFARMQVVEPVKGALRALVLRFRGSRGGVHF